MGLIIAIAILFLAAAGITLYQIGKEENYYRPYDRRR